MKKLIVLALVASGVGFAMHHHTKTISEEIENLQIPDIGLQERSTKLSYQEYDFMELSVKVYEGGKMISKISLPDYIPFPVDARSLVEKEFSPLFEGGKRGIFSYNEPEFYSKYFSTDISDGDFFQFKFFYSFDVLNGKGYFSIHPYVGKYSEGIYGDLFVAANTHFYEINELGNVRKVFKVDDKQIMPTDVDSYAVEYLLGGSRYYHVDEIALDDKSTDELQNFSRETYFVDQGGNKTEKVFNLIKK